MKAIIFDSGTLISFTMAGLLPELKELKKIFKGKFIISHQVKREVIDKPLDIKQFALSALKLKSLLDEGVLELPNAFKINENNIITEMDNLLDIANNTLFERSHAIKLIDDGEASCLALSKLLSNMKIENVIAIDERTTRLLSESPENLRKIMQKKLHTKIDAKSENYKHFDKFRFIRSTELVYVAYKKGLTKLKNHNILDALLYALKFKGCSINGDEIRQIERIK